MPNGPSTHSASSRTSTNRSGIHAFTARSAEEEEEDIEEEDAEEDKKDEDEEDSNATTAGNEPLASELIVEEADSNESGFLRLGSARISKSLKRNHVERTTFSRLEIAPSRLLVDGSRNTPSAIYGENAMPDTYSGVHGLR
jgi:hypothetical protein